MNQLGHHLLCTMQEGWCGTAGSVAEIQSRLQQKQEGAIKRERAKAYAFSHQVSCPPTRLIQI